VLSGLFFGLSLAAYVGYVQRDFSLLRYLISLALFAGGLMSKPMLVTLPCVLLLLDWWPLCRLVNSPHDDRPHPPGQIADRHKLSITAALVEKTPYFALSIAACCVTLVAQRQEIQINDNLSLWTRLANALVAYAEYVGLFVFPHGLNVLYPHLRDTPPIWKIGGSLVALLFVSVCAFHFRRTAPYLLVGWLWFVGMLVPVIGLVQVGDQAMADRYTYLPQVGLSIALVWGLADLARAWSISARYQAIAAVLALMVLMGCAWRQTTYWVDGEALWRRALVCHPDGYVAHHYLGAILCQKGKLDEAVAHLQESQRLCPTRVATYYDLGTALIMQGRAGEAIANLETALKIEPNDPLLHYELGRALALDGQNGGAIRHYETALTFPVNDVVAFNVHMSLGLECFTKGDLSSAIAHYQKAIAINANDAAAHCSLGIVLDRQGKADDAGKEYLRALQADPNNGSAHFNLAKNLCEQRRFDEAAFHFEKTLQLQPQDVNVLAELARALAANGQSQQAIIIYEQALQIDADDPTTHYYFGKTLASVCKLDQASEQFRDALKTKPDFAEAQLELIDTLFAQGKSGAAIAECEQALARAAARQQNELADTLRQRLNHLQPGSNVQSIR
jgi:tetratricopeptide (TPR) repeat protein